MKLQSILFVKLAGATRLSFYFRLSNGNIWTITIKGD